MSWRKAYILVIDKGGVFSSFNPVTFHQKLVKPESIITWWHYIDNTYVLIVEGNVNAAAISEYVKKIDPKRKFFVCELNLKDHAGWLPKEAWEWIKKQLRYPVI